MENVSDNSNSVSDIPNTFVKHVFKFDDDSKSEIMNIIQYSLLAIIPILLLNKSIHRYIPEVDESKESLEILMEVGIQTVVMFIGILIIHRFITYFPTYSTIPYPTLFVTNIILGFMIIMLSIQTKFGEKSNILFERIMDIINGRVNIKEGMVSQKIKEQLPPPPIQRPDFSKSYEGPDNPLVDAEIPSINNTNVTTSAMTNNNNNNNNIESFENPLMAANEIGGSFGAAF